MSCFITYHRRKSGIKLYATENSGNILNETEPDTIKSVCDLFAETNAGDISRTSHLEKGWIENVKDCSAISYQDAFVLNYD